MRTFFLSFAMLIFVTTMSAQIAYNQENTNPLKMGWMQGFPPEADKVVSASDGSFFEFPALRYSVCHIREFMPTTVVKSAQENRYQFKTKIDKRIDTVSFTPMYQTGKMTWQEAMDKTFADGVIILHKGRIVYEKYFGALESDGTHAVMSVSKSFTGTLGALMLAQGVLDEYTTIKQYVPELRNSAFADATVRNLLDMTTALQYSEDYSNPNAEVYQFSAAGTPCHPDNYQGPKCYYEYLETVKKAGEHGKKFAYKTINVDALGWVISRATGKSVPELLSELIWQPLGANHDGYYQVDSYGIAFAGGGFNANLRDLAMFGEMLCNRGQFNGKRILPESIFYDIIENASNKTFDNEEYKNLKGWGYRNMFWVTNNANHAFCARGVYGQVIYIDPTAEMVIVRLASNPTAANAANDPYSLPAYQAVADYLMRK